MPDLDNIKQELEFKAVRSSGPGGQHVNKTSSKVIAQFDVMNSNGLSQEEKDQVLKKLSSRITNEGKLIVESSSTRSQHKNKEIGIEKLCDTIIAALKKPRVRKKTKPSKASKLKRLREKKLRGLKKENRQKPDL